VTFAAVHTLSTRGYEVATLNWFAAHYYEFGGPACHKEDFFNFNSTIEHTAECVCGVAEIEIFAYAAAFNRNKDNAVIPAICNDHCACTGRRCGWKFYVPCDLDNGPTPHKCPSRRVLSESAESETDQERRLHATSHEIAPVDKTTTNECSSVWAYGSKNSKAFCLGQLKKGKSGWTNTLKASAEPVSFELLAHQEDCRDIGFPVGKVWVSSLNGKVVVNYTMDEGFDIKQTNLFVGSRRRLPKLRIDEMRQEVFDPELFPLNHTNLRQANDSFVVDIDSKSIYVAAHAIVCGDFTAKEAELRAARQAYLESLVCIDEKEVAQQRTK